MTENSEIQVEIQDLMQKGQFSSALVKVSAICIAEPKNVEAYYFKAVCERYLKKYTDAQATLETLRKISPEFGRGLQEEGHLNRDQGLYDAALDTYQRACRANPALIASWREQVKILDRKGRTVEAANIKLQADRLAALPKELVTVNHFIHEGKTLIAEKLCRKFLQSNPHHIEGMRLLADMGHVLASSKTQISY